MDKMLYTVAEAAKLLSLSRATLYELMAGGRLASVRVGRARRIPAVAMQSFIKDQLEDAA